MTSKRKVHARRRQRKNRIRRQRGRGLDIQKLLAKTGREFHLSGGYQLAGSGTQLQKRLALGSQYDWGVFWIGQMHHSILPPTELYHPVLPYRDQGKLTFPLCRRARRNGETAQRETSGVSSHGRGVRVAWKWGTNCGLSMKCGISHKDKQLYSEIIS